MSFYIIFYHIFNSGYQLYLTFNKILLCSRDAVFRNFYSSPCLDNYLTFVICIRCMIPNQNLKNANKVKMNVSQHHVFNRRTQFEGGVVGKALKGPICTFEFSGGVSMDHSAVVGLVATTVAHEMGHNFGMEHDSSECQCPEDRCIMAPSSR